MMLDSDCLTGQSTRREAHATEKARVAFHHLMDASQSSGHSPTETRFCSTGSAARQTRVVAKGPDLVPS